MPPTAVLFLTHQWDETKRRRLSRLQAEIGGQADVYLLAQKSAAIKDALGKYAPPTDHTVLFDAPKLPRQLGYPFAFSNALCPGSAHFTLLALSQKRKYSHYFLVEHDVEFSGDWGNLLQTIVAAGPDFATFHVNDYEQRPDWPWWFFRPGRADRDWAGEKTNLRRSFNPLSCLSHQATEIIHEAHRDGWQGHYEMLLATVLTRRGCKVMDMADMGRFCVGREQDMRPHMPNETLSTMRWRPEITKQEFLARSTESTVFHPVKAPWYFDGSRIVTIGEESPTLPP